MTAAVLLHRVAGGALVLFLGGCLTPPDYNGRSCPCIDGWVCDEVRNVCIESLNGPDAGCSGAACSAVDGGDAGCSGPACSTADAGDAGCERWWRGCGGAVDAGVDAGCSGPGCSAVDSGVDAGCSGGPECYEIVPSNVAGAVSFSDSSVVLDIPDGEIWTIDSDDGSIDARVAGTMTYRAVRAPGAGTIDGIRYEQVASGAFGVGDYGVFAIGGLHVAPMAQLVASSGRRRALVVVSAGDVVVDGVVTAGASFRGPGPGGGAGGLVGAGDGGSGAGGSGGAGGREAFGNDDGGGGGGGLGSAGAPGGGAGTSGSSAPGGGPRCTQSLAPLCAGSGGGAGADNDGGRGGHGGGALQITSASSIVINGHVDASGEGGHGGIATFGHFDTGAGGGGGSGGAILLEARTVTIAGGVSALGGAGGQGARCDDCASSGADGAAYDPGTTPPAPGTSSEGAGGGGGAGADAVGSAGAGLASPNGGGGGGGAGRIRIHTSSGTESYGGALLYPTMESGLATVATATLAPR